MVVFESHWHRSPVCIAAAVLDVWTASALQVLLCTRSLERHPCTASTHCWIQTGKHAHLGLARPVAALRVVPSVAVLLFWSVWQGSSLDQHQHGECADVYPAPICHWGFVCARRQAGEREQCLLVKNRVIGGGSLCRQLAPPPPGPGSVRLRSFDLE